MHITTERLDELQKIVLIVISFAFLAAVPSVWLENADSANYIGTAESIVNEGRYWFNGQPNLLYYPGYPTFLSILIFLFGVNYFILQLSSALFIIISLWLSRSYFSLKTYGIPGLLVPLLLAFNAVVQEQTYRVMSDGMFICLTLGTMLWWRLYSESRDWRYF